MERTEAMIPFVDAHTHRRIRTEGVCGIRNRNFPEDSGDDTPHAGWMDSAGVHPRDAGRIRLDSLEDFLRRHDCGAIGECGLDRSTDVDWNVQTDCFLQQAKLAESLAFPLVIHCVRAFPELISLRKTHSFSVPWIVHGFRGKEQIARELMRHGMTLSLSPVWILRSSSLYDCFHDLRFLLETDDRTESIETIYAAAAHLLNREMREVKEGIFLNFKKIFSTGVME